MKTTIPQFKNTQEAISFGLQNKGNQQIISDLKEERAHLETEVEKMDEAGLEDEAMYLASGQCQFVREAYEAAEEETEEDEGYCDLCGEKAPLRYDGACRCVRCKKKS